MPREELAEDIEAAGTERRGPCRHSDRCGPPAQTNGRKMRWRYCALAKRTFNNSRCSINSSQGRCSVPMPTESWLSSRRARCGECRRGNAVNSSTAGAASNTGEPGPSWVARGLGGSLAICICADTAGCFLLWFKCELVSEV